MQAFCCHRAGYTLDQANPPVDTPVFIDRTVPHFGIQVIIAPGEQGSQSND
jgi:hypothetical protein